MNYLKVFELKCFFLLYITKNLNQENLTKNLATFKRYDWVKDEKF